MKTEANARKQSHGMEFAMEDVSIKLDEKGISNAKCGILLETLPID